MVESIDATTIKAAAQSVGDALIDTVERIAEFAAHAASGWEEMTARIAAANPALAASAQSTSDKILSVMNHLAQGNTSDFDSSLNAFGAKMSALLASVHLLTRENAANWKKIANASQDAGSAGEAAFGGLDAAALQLALHINQIRDAFGETKKLFDSATHPYTTAHSDAAIGGAAYSGVYPGRPGAPSGPQVPRLPAAADDAASGADRSFQLVSAVFEKEIIAAQAAAQAVDDAQSGLLRRHQITSESWLSTSVRALNAELAAIKAAAAEALATDGLKSDQRLRIADIEARQLKEIAHRIRQDYEKAAEEIQSKWDAVFGAIGGAVDSQIGGLLKATTSWRDAFANVLESLSEDLLKFGVKVALQEIEMTAERLAGVNTRVAAHLAGNAAIAGSDAATSAASALGWVGNAFKALAADAAQVFGGVFAFLAPILGPAAAGPAAGASASVLAAGGAIASADIGMWSVPSDMLTMVHHNELIMPAAQASAFRDLLSGGGGAGGANVAIHPTVNIQTSALDGASVGQFYRDNQHQLMRAIDQAVRHGAHLGLRRVAT